MIDVNRVIKINTTAVLRIFIEIQQRLIGIAARLRKFSFHHTQLPWRRPVSFNGRSVLVNATLNTCEILWEFFVFSLFDLVEHVDVPSELIRLSVIAKDNLGIVIDIPALAFFFFLLNSFCVFILFNLLLNHASVFKVFLLCPIATVYFYSLKLDLLNDFW